jgi:hypothetical protein
MGLGLIYHSIVLAQPPSRDTAPLIIKMNNALCTKFSKLQRCELTVDTQIKILRGIRIS